MRSQDENSSQERKQQMKLIFSPKLHTDRPTSKTTLWWKKSLRGYQLHYFCKGRLWDSVIYIFITTPKSSSYSTPVASGMHFTRSLQLLQTSPSDDEKASQPCCFLLQTFSKCLCSKYYCWIGIQDNQN